MNSTKQVGRAKYEIHESSIFNLDGKLARKPFETYTVHRAAFFDRKTRTEDFSLRGARKVLALLKKNSSKLRQFRIVRTVTQVVR